MIDLRSDTISMPTEEMLSVINLSELGDSGRLNKEGRGEDNAVNNLEDYACQLTGKQRALLFSSGTIANTSAILTHCGPRDEVLVDRIQHIYRTEKIVFDQRFGQLIPVFYELCEDGTPDVQSMEKMLKENNIKLIIIENTHNFSGGACIDTEKLKRIKELSQRYNVKIHMDGARLFNASAALNVNVEEIVKYVDSAMFCLSKGLGAPMGSLLIGDKEFIDKATDVKKLLGGNMRQAGIFAAPGLYALKNNVDMLKEDNENAKYVAGQLKSLKYACVQKNVQSNIVMINTSKTGLSPEEYCNRAKEKGLLIRPVLENSVRLVFYKDISRDDCNKAVNIICEIDKEIE